MTKAELEEYVEFLEQTVKVLGNQVVYLTDRVKVLSIKNHIKWDPPDEPKQNLRLDNKL